MNEVYEAFAVTFGAGIVLLVLVVAVLTAYVYIRDGIENLRSRLTKGDAE